MVVPSRKTFEYWVEVEQFLWLILPKIGEPQSSKVVLSRPSAQYNRCKWWNAILPLQTVPDQRVVSWNFLLA